MKTLKEFYLEDNMKVLENYEKLMGEVKLEVEKIDAALNSSDNESFSEELKPYFEFMNHTGKFLVMVYILEKRLDEKHFQELSFEELKEENYKLYEELIGDNYKTSYANPTYGVQIFGDKFGQLMSAFYTSIRQGISYAYKHRIFSLHDQAAVYLELLTFIKEKGADYEGMKSIIVKPYYNIENHIREYKYSLRERMGVEFPLYLNVINESNGDDLRYLFMQDKYITENEIKTARFLQSYPMDKIKKLTKATLEAFLRGFVTENKNRGQRNFVRLYYFVGQEKLLCQLIKDMEEAGLKASVGLVDSTSPNKQYDYDHRFDNGLYFDKEYTSLYEKALEEANEQCLDVVNFTCGPMVFESFGEKPFSPENKKECIKLTPEQESLKQVHNNNRDIIFNRYQPNENTSFGIIAFPSSEIGERFEEIFEDTVKINMLDNNVYEPIQQSIIDALDKGEFVHIKGYKGNETDIRVKLHELKNPEKETNFVNCVADVNIPLGEVFTSPTLKGTEGLLHLKETFLGLKYQNLKLNFKDGYVVDYTCTNFEKEEDNKAYVKENLMELHDKLPLGEFAIGTNTTAYVMAQKYDIIELLPILIIEKMGPHFAIGDTCFTWSEDLPVYNMLDKKEITARDNERTILRKEDINKAYTGVHTDITIPYEEIEYICVVHKDGKTVDIIREGRFVLAGTEELNKAFE